jgi:hypothetical protein
MLPTLRRSTRTRRSPNRYGFHENIKNEHNGLNSIIEAIELLENNGFKIEDPIDKHIDHYNKIGVSVEKSGANSLRFTYEDECPEYYLDDYDFKIALLEAGDDHEKWIQIVEKGIKQWKSNIIDLTN